MATALTGGIATDGPWLCTCPAAGRPAAVCWCCGFCFLLVPPHEANANARSSARASKQAPAVHRIQAVKVPRISSDKPYVPAQRQGPDPRRTTPPLPQRADDSKAPVALLQRCPSESKPEARRETNQNDAPIDVSTRDIREKPLAEQFRHIAQVRGRRPSLRTIRGEPSLPVLDRRQWGLDPPGTTRSPCNPIARSADRPRPRHDRIPQRRSPCQRHRGRAPSRPGSGACRDRRMTVRLWMRSLAVEAGR